MWRHALARSVGACSVGSFWCLRREQISSPNSKEVAVGIDLGTTYSCVGVYAPAGVSIIENQEGSRTTPSYVAFAADGSRLVGEAAKSQAARNPKNTIYDAKRLIGRKFDDPTVLSDAKLWSFEMCRGENAKAMIMAGGRPRHPEEISAMILGKLKKAAEAKLGRPVTKAVITVPAYFNDAQRQATKDAGKIAGLEVLRILNEPTAAALAYGIGAKPTERPQRVLVYDMGGGTFDVTLLELEGGVVEVKATAGDTHLGGEDLSNALLQHCIAEFSNKYPKLAALDARAKRRLFQQCDRAKQELSASTSTTIEVDALAGGFDFELTVTRATFEKLNEATFRRSLRAVERVLSDAKLEKSKVDEIVLVGGSTRVPRVKTLLKEFFCRESLNESVNADEAVAYGAAVQAAILSDAYDASSSLVLLDVAPLSLGIETAGGVMTRIIERNTTIPAKRDQIFTTHADNQPAVDVKIYEGERAFTKDNRLLGSFVLDGIPPAPRGTPRIKVDFDLDANGILSVKALDLATNKTKHIVLQKQGLLSKSKDLDKLLQEARQNEAQDKAALAAVKARNDAEAAAYNAARSADALFQNDESNRQFILNATEDLTQWLKNNPDANSEQVEAKRKQFNESVHPLIQEAYQRAESSSSASSSSTATSSDHTESSGEGSQDTFFDGDSKRR